VEAFGRSDVDASFDFSIASGDAVSNFASQYHCRSNFLSSPEGVTPIDATLVLRRCSWTKLIEMPELGGIADDEHRTDATVRDAECEHGQRAATLESHKSRQAVDRRPTDFVTFDRVSLCGVEHRARNRRRTVERLQQCARLVSAVGNEHHVVREVFEHRLEIALSQCRDIGRHRFFNRFTRHIVAGPALVDPLSRTGQ
jgi:hypothetical protein